MFDSAGVHVIDDLERASAVLHPLRLRILGALASPDSATGISRRFGLSRQQVNYHLRCLEVAGYVELVGERRRRGCTERLVQSVARSFVISPETLGEVAVHPDCVDESETNGALVAAAARVIGDVAEMDGRLDRAGKPLEAMTLQLEVRLPTPGSQPQFMRELSEAVEGVVVRYHDERSAGGRRVRVLVGAYPTGAGEPGPAKSRSWSSRNRKRVP